MQVGFSSSISWAVNAKRARRHWLVAIALSVSALSALPHQTVSAQAAAPDKAMAEMLFDRGLALMRKGQYSEACAQLEQSQSIERGIGTMLYLAECYENLGKTASAWAMFREAASAARAGGQNERASAGMARADKLEPLLSKLTINVAAGNSTPGLLVLRNGVAVPAGVWGLASPTDPGEQRIEASAPGRIGWSVTVALPGGGATLSVDVPELAMLPGQDPPPSAAAAAVEQPSTTAALSVSTPANSDSGWRAQKPLAFVLGGVGVVGLGIGAVFGANAIARHNEEEKLCRNALVCNDAVEANRANQRAHNAATLANVFVIGGAIALAAGVVLYLTAPSEERALAVGFLPRGDGAEIALGGRL